MAHKINMNTINLKWRLQTLSDLCSYIVFFDLGITVIIFGAVSIDLVNHRAAYWKKNFMTCRTEWL
jgi:hypothetical protein